MKKNNKDYNWIIKITISAFFISVIFSYLSDSVFTTTGIIVNLIILFLFIFIGILFDIIGLAVTTALEKPIHSMNSRRVKGAKLAIVFKKNCNRVSSFCNDVVGDICGIVSGSAGLMLSQNISHLLNINLMIITLVITGLIASLTIGGKAVGKNIAIKNSNSILIKFARVISVFYKVK